MKLLLLDKKDVNYLRRFQCYLDKISIKRQSALEISSFNQFENMNQEYRNADDDKFREYTKELHNGLLDESGGCRGPGILDPILKDEEITELMVNDPENSFVEKKAEPSGLIKPSMTEASAEMTRSLMRRR